MSRQDFKWSPLLVTIRENSSLCELKHRKRSHKKYLLWTSLAVQWLRLHTSTAGDTGSIPGRGTKIPQSCTVQPKKKICSWWMHSLGEWTHVCGLEYLIVTGGFYTLYLFFFNFLSVPHSLRDLSSPTRYRTQDLAVKAQSLNQCTARKFPHCFYLYR